MGYSLNVTLVRYTNDPQEAIELAASNCYNSKPNGKIMKACYESGHKSVLEFAQFHFHIEGISRVTSHQLVRHRTASFAQRSQRFCSSFGNGIPELPKGDIKSHGGQRFYNNQQQFISEMYQRGFTTTELSNIYGGDCASIFCIIRKYCQTRSFSESKNINKQYFSQIDSYSKAYILGFLYSDGCLSIKKNGLKQIILDQLAEEELLLTNIIREIKPNGNITHSGHDSMIRVAIQDNDLCSNLEKYGIIVHKGLFADFTPILQNVPCQYISEVIRGIFEGDGHIGLKYNAEGKIVDARFSIAGTYNTCENIQKILIKEVGVSQTKISHKANKCYSLNYGGRLQVIKIIKWIYQNADMRFIHLIKARTIFKLVPEIKAKYINSTKEYVYNNFDAIIPPSILNNVDASSRFILLLIQIKDTYINLQKELAYNGIYGEKANEDARFVLPNACCTNIDVSFDFRNLAHFMNERLCRKAQWEIRELAQKMRQCVIEVFPEAASMLVPKCEMNEVHFCSEKKPCGRYPKLTEMLHTRESDGE